MSLLPNNSYGTEICFYSAILPCFIPGDYTVTWNNCCRNPSIANLINPGALSMFLDCSFTVDLTTLSDKNLSPEDLKEEGVNEFAFVLPHSQTSLTYKILTHGDEKNIEREITGLQKIKPDSNPEISTRLKYIITSVDGDREKKTIREFVDSIMLARDSRALREEIRRVSPDVELKYVGEGAEEGINIPINLNFFWPDSGI